MNKDSNFPERQDQRLLPIKLANFIYQGLTINIDISVATSEEMTVFQFVLPTIDNDTFLTFSYKDSAERINNASNDLTSLDQPFFKFHKEREELRGMEFANMNTMEKEKMSTFSSAMITYVSYKALKKCCEAIL